MTGSSTLSTVYRMLDRHGWRKLSSDTAHPQGDTVLLESWKKLKERLDKMGVVWSNH
ncbi:winged helix-turn-helix domain-containing protein [Nitrosomonas communis]|uniref:Winged helix-turn helix n=1 Tax=Nitrosomonas communis TaxID=44574 RepID=A0A1I4TVN5_9PROT|nr:winged helix-turn-helix domain-containing protein [Nitrosomonas communis]SFM80655.1 Winged helix-turn helix [Nitrosomonas communis]